jgi:hypothetical protein
MNNYRETFSLAVEYILKCEFSSFLQVSALAWKLKERQTENTTMARQLICLMTISPYWVH